MDRKGLKGTALLTAGVGAVAGLPASGCGLIGPCGSTVIPCCDADAGVTTNCRADVSCSPHGVSINPADGGDSGVVGFFVPDGGDAGQVFGVVPQTDGGEPDGGDAGQIFGTIVNPDGGTDAG